MILRNLINLSFSFYELSQERQYLDRMDSIQDLFIYPNFYKAHKGIPKTQ